MDKLARELEDIATIIMHQVQRLGAVMGELDGAEQNANNKRLEFKLTQKQAGLEAVKETKPMPPKYSDGSLRARPSGTYEYRFMHLGKRISVYGTSEQECYNKRTDIIAGKQKNKLIKSSTTLLYSDWLDKWFETYKRPYNGDKHNETTLYNIKRVKAKLGAMPINKLTGLQLQEFINQFLDSPNTQRKIADVLRGSLRKAVALQLIKFNPFDAVELLPKSKAHYRSLEIDEQNQIYNAIDGKYKELFMFCCCTGIRISRALSLTVEDFDQRRNEIIVLKKQRKGANETYIVPYLPELINLPSSGAIFPDITYNGIKKYLQRLYKKLNIRGVMIHSFRHTFISCCYHIGIRDKQIQFWAGHSSLQMTMDTYTHLLKNGETSPILEYLQRLKARLGL